MLACKNTVILETAVRLEHEQSQHSNSAHTQRITQAGAIQVVLLSNGPTSWDRVTAKRRDNAMNSKPQVTLDFALPDHDGLPTELPQLVFISTVSCYVGRKLVLPEVDSRTRCRSKTTGYVSMPEAPMHQDGNA